jgi:alternate signal-mediated exported protein
MTETTVDKRSNRRIKGLIAGAAGVALLLGGSTFALWSANGTAGGGTITAGNLDLTAEAAAFHDISSDRTDTDGATNTAVGVPGHPIGDSTALGSYRIVPGDTIAGVYEYEITLLGDNLVADLNLAFATGGTSTLANLGLTYDLKITSTTGTLVEETDQSWPTVDGKILTQSFQAYETADARIDKNGGTALPMVGSDGKAKVKLVIKATLPGDTVTDRVDVGMIKELNTLTATLTQSRTTGNGNFS